MKKGINQWAFPSSISVKEILELAHQFGFQGVELCPSAQGELSFPLTQEKISEIRNLAQDFNLEIRSIATDLLWKYNLASSNQNSRKKAKEIVKRLIETAANLGAQSVLIIPGYVNVPWDSSSEVVPYQEAFYRVQESLKELAPLAQEAKVYLAIENVWNKLFLSPLEFCSLIDSIESRWVKAHFDTANVLIAGYPEQWIKLLGERIITVHIKDFKLSVGNINGFCLPLEGDVNWPQVMQSLQDIGYDDYLIAKVIPPYSYSKEALLANISFNLDCLLKMP